MERLYQHSVEPQLTCQAELFDAYYHPVVARSGLIAISSHQAIPPWQVETKVAVSLADYDRVVDAMHVGCDHKPPKVTIEWDRDTNIAVIERRGCVR
jgi:hypothetical protein